MDLYVIWTFIWQRVKKHKMLALSVIMLLSLISFGSSILSQPKEYWIYTEDEVYADTTEGQVFTNQLSDSTAETVQSIRIPDVNLQKGIYIITVNYQSDNGGTVIFSGRGRDARSCWYNDISLIRELTETSGEYWVNDLIEDFHINILSNDGNLTVNSITVQSAWNSKLYQFICLILKILLLGGIGFLVIEKKELSKNAHVIFGILGIAFICSIGLFTRYMICGHDTLFHLNRIEGLKDGLLAGMFPVRVQPTWNYGWGYAVSLMYGDITLIPAALMRICGFTIQTTWKSYIVLVNLVTAIVAFWSFHKIVKDKYKALFTTLIYCTGLYRIACIYVRAAVGEFTVLIFLPLVVLGFWYAFTEDIESPEYGKKLFVPIIGFTGMIQTHILTCEMLTIFIILLCIILIKKVIRKKTFLYLSKIVIGTILVNLWFLIPFLTLYKEDIIVSKVTDLNKDFQMWGLSVTELFVTTATNAYNFTYAYNDSLAAKCTFTIGTAMWIMAVVTMILLFQDKMKKKKAVKIMLAFGLISAAMATNLFPYRDIMTYFPKLFQQFGKMQFSFRFLGMASLFFTLMILFLLIHVTSAKIRKIMKTVIIVISVVALLQGMDYQYQFLYGGSAETRYSTASLYSTHVVSGEYLYDGSSTEVTVSEQKITGNQVDILDISLDNLTAKIKCKATGDESYVEVPRFYYPGYVAFDETGETYKITKSSNNNRIHVDIPDSFEGELTITYREPVYWRICEVISLIAFILLLAWRRREMKLENH